MTPSVVFGMTLYNNARHLPQAVESLLAQTDPDFALLMVDDGSSDDTEAVARRYESRDARVRYLRHTERLGMVPTWREAVDWALRDFPSARYFAWASDHDWWHPEWLARTRAALEHDPDAVLAYPLTQRVDGELQPVDKAPKAFATSGTSDPAARVLAFAREPVGAGDMVYGLMRVDALVHAGAFRPVLQPDRLLMIELALAGTFVQVPEVLWLRRQPKEASVARQRTTLFAESRAPRSLMQPVWLQHSRVLLREYVFRAAPALVQNRGDLETRSSSGLPPRLRGSAVRNRAVLARAGVMWLILRYQLAYLVRHYNKEGALLHRLDQRWEAVDQQFKETRRALRWACYRTSRTLAPSHIARVVRKYWLHAWNRAVYRAAVARRRVRAATYEARATGRAYAGRVRRAGRKARYEILVLTHRLGLRGR